MNLKLPFDSVSIKENAHSSHNNQCSNNDAYNHSCSVTHTTYSVTQISFIHFMNIIISRTNITFYMEIYRCIAVKFIFRSWREEILWFNLTLNKMLNIYIPYALWRWRTIAWMLHSINVMTAKYLTGVEFQYLLYCLQSMVLLLKLN